MTQCRMSLRRSLAVVFSGLAALALLVAIALVFLTSRVHEAARVLRESVESVFVAEEAAKDLLFHARLGDSPERVAFEERVWQNLARARDHAASESESRILSTAESKTRTYFESQRGTPPSSARVEAEARALDEALDAVNQLVLSNVAQAGAAELRGSTSERLANFLGFGLAGAMLSSVAIFSFWVRRALHPVFDVARAMERFAMGEHGVRVPERGARELRYIAQRFNQMSSTLYEQRQRQFAFLAGVAHDLRNPLSVLRMSAALFADDRPLPPESKLRHTLGLVWRQVDRLDRMVGDLLDVTSMEAGQLNLRLQELDLNESVLGAVELLAESSAAHPIRTSLPDTSILVWCDPHRIEQILVNLLSNAIKYSPEGGDIVVGLRQERGRAVLAVTDPGIGISEEDQRVLFEPFLRRGTLSDAIPGMGLGLYVVRRIVAAHGGKIEVESRSGHGSTFRVYLPLSARKGAGAELGPDGRPSGPLH